MGDLDMPEADWTARQICDRAGAVVVSVDYRLCVGGVTYPVPHDDVVAAVRWVRDNAGRLGIDRGRISLGGASAGGNLATGAALRLRDDDGWLPAALLLAYTTAHAVVPPASASLAAADGRGPAGCSASCPRTAAASPRTTSAGRASRADGYAMPGQRRARRALPRRCCSTPSTTTCALRRGRSPPSSRVAGVDVRQVIVRGMLHGFLNLHAGIEPVDAGAGPDGRGRPDGVGARAGPRVTPNPLLPGFNPDPSIVRVDGVYYLVTSTFEYLPGLPVYRSTDLVEWTQIGNVATRPEQVELEQVPTPGGVWAPTIRYRDGIFYVIVTVMLGGRGCVVFTATDPAGPWSDGTPIPAVDGIDPDLAWDDDGTAYVTFAGFPHADPAGARRPGHRRGAGGAARRCGRAPACTPPEAPHLYRRGDHWYLLIAEGGTDRGHARQHRPRPVAEGPWEGNPANPVLTRPRHRPRCRTWATPTWSRPRTAAPRWCCSASGPSGFGASVLPAGPGDVPRPPCAGSTAGRRPTWSTPHRHAGTRSVFDFDLTRALDDPAWLAVRRTPAEVAAVADGRLAITGDGSTLDDPRPWFLGRRQRHLTATVSTRVDASAGTGGLAARYDEEHWFALEAAGDGTATTVTARAALAGLDQHLDAPSCPAGEVELRIEIERPPTGFVADAAGGDRIRLVAGGRRVLAEFDGRYWTFEVAKSFTGRVSGSTPPRAPSRSPTSATAAPTTSPRRPPHEHLVPRRLPLGRRHRRPPGRGRQRQQRPLGDGARAALAVRRAQRRRLRLLPPLARGPGPGRRRRAEHLPVQPRVEPDRARGGRVLPRRPRPLPADGRRLPRPRARPRSSRSCTSRCRAG